MKFISSSFIISLLVCCPLFELQAQYLGGDGDGYAVVRASNVLLDGGNLAAVYLGGVGDGYAMVDAANLPLGSGPPSPLVFRVERTTGNVFAAGSFIPTGADLAERIHVSESVEPGDVVELDPSKPGHYRRARGFSPLVAGIITTEPGFTLGNNPDEKQSDIRPMLALMGRVPVKATTENGPIRPGDLLTISSKPGYAMRCHETTECVIIGKALEGLEKREGKILVLVMAR